jgi:predicted metal-dependent HD superfamily phosphohydrolase
MDKYKKRFYGLCPDANVSEIDKIFDDIVERHCESHRFYHNIDHVKFCLEELDAVKKEIEAPLSLELALWHHDIIYDVKSSTNEEDSARLAGKNIKELGLSDNIIDKVQKLILATKYPHAPENNDEKFIQDIDLAILGAAREKYLEYSINIRKEYSWVPEKTYKTKRIEVLKAFQMQKRIYNTEYYFNELEASARLNLENEIISLSS